MPPILDYLESVAPAGEGSLVGEALTLADIAIAGPFATLRYTGIEMDAGRYPKLAAYLTRILARPSFTAWMEREQKLLERVRAAA